MLPLLLFVLVAEVAVLIAVGNVIGALATVALLAVISLAGVALLRRQGARTMGSFVEAMRARRDPQPEMVDGMLLGVAGVLVIFPGFVTDVLALFLLLPPTRKAVRKRILARAGRRAQAAQQQPGVVDGEVVDDEPDTAPPVIEGEVVDEEFRR